MKKIKIIAFLILVTLLSACGYYSEADYEADLDSARENAYNDGFSDGYGDGYEDGYEEGYELAYIEYDKTDIINEYTSPKIGKCYSCNVFYSYIGSWGFGLCSDCYEDILVPCCICEESTFPCYNNKENTICPHCIGVLFDETDFEDYIIDFFSNY